MDMLNSQPNLHSNNARMAGLCRLLQLILMATALGVCGVGYGQVKKKPAQKTWYPINLGENINLYPSRDSACQAALSSQLSLYTYTKVDQITCYPTDLTVTRTTTGVAFYIGSNSSGGSIYCGIGRDDTINYSGALNACGIQESVQTYHWDAYYDMVREGRVCDSAAGWNQFDQTSCVRSYDPYPPAGDCPKCGNPTSVGSGSKQESFILGRIPSGPRTIPLELRYANQFHLSGGQMLGEPSWFLEPADRRLNLRFVASIWLPRVVYSRGHGMTEEFHTQAGGLYKSFDPQVSLVKTSSTATPWKRVDYREAVVEQYDSLGRLVTLRYFSGGGFDLSYASSTALLPNRLTTTTGQQVQFLYTGTRLSNVQLPNGSNINLAYQNYSDAAKHIAGSYLKTIAYPDGRSVSFDYVPGMALPAPLAGGAISADGKQIWGVPADSPSEGGPVDTSDPVEYGRAFFNLSGKTDENNQPYADFQYDDQGRVLISQHSGNTYRHEFNYQSNQTVVTQPLSSVSTFYLTVVNEQLRLSNLTRSATNFNHSVSFNHDEQGNLISRYDGGNNSAQCMKVDPNNNRPVILLESASGCPADLATYVPTGDERKTSTQYHPDWRLESRIAEPGKITTLVYNGQPDPTAGNAVASCAPSTALLPDGKPIAVLCKRVEQATTDLNGAAGFAAASQAGVAARAWKWTYNQYGQVLTEDGPRTDVDDVTTYTYHAATAFTGVDPNAVGVTLGDLKTVTNAANKTTQYTKYNKHGQLLESIDPNGVVSSFTYDLRQRMLSATVGGQTTSYTYDPVGQLKKVTRPDTSWVGYDYDPAHRLIAAYDNLGNRVDYTLDNAGNKIAENLKDPAGALRKQLARSIDALGRVQQTTGRE